MHIELASTNNNLGALYERLGRLSEAEFYYMKSILIAENSYGIAHPDLATSYRI